MLNPRRGDIHAILDIYSIVIQNGGFVNVFLKDSYHLYIYFAPFGENYILLHKKEGIEFFSGFLWGGVGFVFVGDRGIVLIGFDVFLCTFLCFCKGKVPKESSRKEPFSRKGFLSYPPKKEGHSRTRRRECLIPTQSNVTTRLPDGGSIFYTICLLSDITDACVSF